MLLQMADLTHERVRAYFDEPDLGRLAVGQPIVIKWDAKPGVEWHGHVERLPVTVVTYLNRTVGEVLVQIDDSSAGLLPDTNVTVTVTTSTEPDILSIPREALQFENGNPYVFKVVNGSLVRTPVTTGTFNVTRRGDPLRPERRRLGGNWHHQRTTVARGRSDQGFAVMQSFLHGLRVVALLLGAALPAAASTQVVRQPLAEINADLQAGEADKALALIGSLPQGGSNIAQAKFLECRVRYALRQCERRSRRMRARG